MNKTKELIEVIEKLYDIIQQYDYVIDEADMLEADRAYGMAQRAVIRE